MATSLNQISLFFLYDSIIIYTFYKMDANAVTSEFSTIPFLRVLFLWFRFCVWNSCSTLPNRAEPPFFFPCDPACVEWWDNKDVLLMVWIKKKNEWVAKNKAWIAHTMQRHGRIKFCYQNRNGLQCFAPKRV